GCCSVTPEIHKSEGDCEVPRVKDLHGFTHDLLARQPRAVCRPCQNHFRKDVASILTASDALIDDADGCVHPGQCAGTYHDKRGAQIPTTCAHVVLSISF